MTESKAPASASGKRAAVDKAGKARADAAIDSQLAEQAQHDAKVALQNARFAELGKQMDVKTSLGELGVKVK